MNQAILLSAERDVPDLEALLERIRAGEATAVSEFKEACGEGIRFFLRRTYPLEDLEEAFGRVWEALIGRLRNGAAARSLGELVRQAARDCGLVAKPKPPVRVAGSMRAALRDCSARERIFLERCYLKGDDPAAVGAELRMTPEEVTALYQKVGRPGTGGRSRRAAAG